MSKLNDSTTTDGAATADAPGAADAATADAPGAACADADAAGKADRKALAIECPAALIPWRVEVYGDARDDLRAALSAGSDTADDLVALELALRALADDPSDLDAETRQRALQSATRQLHARTTLLIEIFDYLWLAR